MIRQIVRDRAKEKMAKSTLFKDSPQLPEQLLIAVVAAIGRIAPPIKENL